MKNWISSRDLLCTCDANSVCLDLNNVSKAFPSARKKSILIIISLRIGKKETSGENLLRYNVQRSRTTSIVLAVIFHRVPTIRHSLLRLLLLQFLNSSWRYSLLYPIILELDKASKVKNCSNWFDWNPLELDWRRRYFYTSKNTRSTKRIRIRMKWRNMWIPPC